MHNCGWKEMEADGVRLRVWLDIKPSFRNYIRVQMCIR